MRLPLLRGLQRLKLRGVRLDGVGEGQDELGPLGKGRLAPFGEGGARVADGGVEILFGGDGDLVQRLAG